MFDSVNLSGSSGRKREHRKDHPDDKLVRTLMGEYCPANMKAYQNSRRDTVNKLAFLKPPPKNKYFQLNEKHDVAASAIDVSSEIQPNLVTWDFSTTLLKSASNRDIAAAVVKQALQTVGQDRATEVKERVKIYFETLKRFYGRIVSNSMDAENHARSKSRRIARVHCTIIITNTQSDENDLVLSY